MNKILLAFSILFFTQTVQGQKDNEVIYMDSNNQYLTAEQFDYLKTQKKRVTLYELETDSVTYKQIFVWKNYGKLDSIQHKQLKIFLTKLTGPTFDGSKNTMIHLYAQTGKHMKNDKRHKKYWSWIETNSDRFQAYLIGEKDSGMETNKVNNTYLDSYNLLHNLFFRKSPFEINHLFVKPNGEIYIYYGGEDILSVLDFSV